MKAEFKAITKLLQGGKREIARSSNVWNLSPQDWPALDCSAAPTVNNTQNSK
ncbi:hypothetical protein [Marinobacter gelidimuriae]|uniref:hypothetical protein n=1 Tax=Marinobacter gelidimuriae TaxID=2739064 RepID=UPI00037CD120|nr:hypothetical protein [Marinobacter gelidimuriae]